MTRNFRWRDDMVMSFMLSLLSVAHAGYAEIDLYMYRLMTCAAMGAKQGDC